MSTSYTACKRLAQRTALLLAPLAYSVARAAPAWATSGAAAALWIGISDSDAVPVETYGLSLNNGSLADPTAAPPALSMHWVYSFFLAIVSLPVWLVRNVESFHWLEIIAGPFDFLGNQLTAMVHSPTVVLAVGTIAAAIIGVTIAIGRFNRGVAMIVTAIVLAYLSVALGAKPLDALIGPSGTLTSGRDIGIETAAELSGKSTTGQAAVDAQSASLADNFIRIPTQEMNFGADIDAAPYNCGPTWSNAIKAADIDKVKDAVATCNDGKKLHDYAMADPTSRKLLVFFAVIFALTVLVVFGFLSVLVVILALSAIFWFIVALVALVTGWIPGNHQDLALKATLDGIFSFFGMIFFTAITGITGNLTGAMFAQAAHADASNALGGAAIVVAMPMVTLLLIALVIALWKVRRGLVSGRERAVRAVRAFTGRTATTSDNGLLDRLDPLTAIPNATHRLTRLATHTAKTAAKTGLSTAVPEAAPFLQAADLLAARVNAKNLKSARRGQRNADQSTHQTKNAAPPANGDATARIQHITDQPPTPAAAPPSSPAAAALAPTRLCSDSWMDTMGNEPVDSLIGVGPATKKRLADLGINTVGQLARSDDDMLKSTFGPQQGHYLWLLANGGGADVKAPPSPQQPPPAQTPDPAARSDRHLALPGPRAHTQAAAEHPFAQERLHPAILAIARNHSAADAATTTTDNVPNRLVMP